MSKFCKNCGAQLNPAVKFCGSCGTKVQTDVQAVPSANASASDYTAPAAKKRGAPRKKLLISAVAVILVVALGAAIFPKLGAKPNDLITTVGTTDKFSFDQRDYDTKAKELDVSQKKPTASAYGVSIDFGEYGLEGPEKLEIRELPQKVDKQDDVKVTAYDFSLGGQSEFEDVLTITIPYDKRFVQAGAEHECVGAKYYNKLTGEWEGVNYEVDVRNRQVSIYTTHLSTFGVFQVKNENTRKAYITDISDTARFFSSEKSYAVLQELAETGQPGTAAFEAGFEVVNSVVGNTGTAVTAITLGGQYEGALADTLGKGTQHLGLAMAAVQTCYEFTYKFNDNQEKMSTLSNLAKNIANNAVGYFGSAALQVGFAGVAVFDMVLSTVQSDMVELKLENIGDVYQYYNDVEAPRSAKEWRRLFITMLQENKENPEKAKQLIEAEIDSFCGRFWALNYGKVKEIAAVSGKKYSFDERQWTKDREVLTAQYRAHLMHRLQAPLTSARKFLLNQAMEQSQATFEKWLRTLRQELNKTVQVKVIEQPEKAGKYQYAGYIVRFEPLSDRANAKSWTGKMPKNGELNTAFTILGHMQSGSPNQVALYKPGSNTPVLVVPFKVSYPSTTILLSSKAQEKADEKTQNPADKPSESEAETVQEYEWVLVDTVTCDAKEDIAQSNENRKGSYAFGGNAAPGQYSSTWQYVGDTDTYPDPDMIYGEGFGAQAIFGTPPSRMRAGETVSLSLALSFTENTVSYFAANASASADFDAWDTKPGGITRNAIRFANTAGKNHFEIYYAKKYPEKTINSVNETLTAAVPSGSEEGDKIAIRTIFNASHVMGTNYIYEWQKAGKSEKPKTQAEKEYAWVLTETKTNDWQEALAIENKSKAGQWRSDVSASQGSATFTLTFIGNTDKTLNLIHGMSENGQVTWTAPSHSLIKPGEEFCLTIGVQHLGSKDKKSPSGGWMGLAQYFLADEAGEQSGGASYLTDRDGNTSFTSGTGNHFAAFNKTVYGKAGSGAKEGDKMTIRVSASGVWAAVKTYYIYQWRPVDTEVMPDASRVSGIVEISSDEFEEYAAALENRMNG